MPSNTELEEYALTSIENVLLSLYVYHRSRKVYPKSVEIISWEFKRDRFKQTLEAINTWKPSNHEWPPSGEKWPPLQFFPVGDLWGRPKERALADEAGYINTLQAGMAAYYNDQEVQAVIRRRNVWNSRDMARKFYTDYPLPF